MSYNLTTKSGHNFFDMASMLQKAIRRCDIPNAGYACNELYYNYSNYVWKRLYVISAEDCYGIITKEIVALKQADDFVNKGKKGGDRDLIFVSKALTLLCLARKNRDACYVACNFMYPDRDLRPEEIEHVDISQYPKLSDDAIPDYVFDHHTLKGKMAGKTDLDMTISEQKALKPLQPSLFDEADWGNYYNQERKDGHISFEEFNKVKEWQKGKDGTDPTHNGANFPPSKTSDNEYQGDIF